MMDPSLGGVFACDNRSNKAGTYDWVVAMFLERIARCCRVQHQFAPETGCIDPLGVGSVLSE